MIRLVHPSTRCASFSTPFLCAVALTSMGTCAGCAAPATPPESTPVYSEHVHPAGARVEVHKLSVSEPQATPHSTDVPKSAAASPPPLDPTPDPVGPDPVPEAAPKSAPEAAPKSAPEAAPKSAPEAAPKSAPEAAPSRVEPGGQP